MFQRSFLVQCLLLTVIVMIIVFLVQVPVYGENKKTDKKDILDISLEELLNTEITTASMKAEDIMDAPGIVSVITAHEIKQFGANNLIEVLERIPGIYGMWGYALPQNSIAMRGDAYTFNAHILMLINGRPMLESFVGGINSVFLTGFPLEAIERIEVIRGPGSVLYGTNAYSGVINIIPRGASTDDNVESSNRNNIRVTMGGGSFGTTLGRLYAGITKGKFNAVANVNFLKEKGWQFDAGMTPASSVSIDMSENILSGNLYATYGGFSLAAFWGKNKQAHMSPAPSLLPSDFEEERLFLDIGYKGRISTKWQASLNVTYNNMLGASFRTAPGIVMISSARDVLVEATNYLNFSPRLNMVIGGSIYFQSSESELENLFFSVPPTAQTWWNTYFQVNYQASKKLKLIAGGQFNQPQGLDVDFVPRFGAIVDITGELGIKFLYGHAFRAAFAAETQVNIPGGGVGNPDLVPEKIKTTDVQLFYKTKKVQLSAAYFNSKQKNLITFVPSPDPAHTVEYRNLGEIVSHGFEMEAKLVPMDNLLILASFCYQENKNQDNVEDVLLVPNTLVKLGISYTGKRGVSIGLFNLFSSKPGDVSNVNPNAFPPLNRGLESVNNLTAKVSLDINKMFNLSKSFSLSLYLYGRNLLNEKIEFPDILFRLVDSVPGRGGRAIYGGMRIEF